MSKYRPSNGSEGCWFTGKFCDQCIKFPHSPNAEHQCEIFLASMCFDIEDDEYPKQWRYQNGEPICTAFKSREEYNKARREKRKPREPVITSDKNQLAMEL